MSSGLHQRNGNETPTKHIGIGASEALVVHNHALAQSCYSLCTCSNRNLPLR